MTETNIFYETGDIQFSTCQTIVVPVNCEGTMDEGIASIFRRRYPYMFERYKWICEQGLPCPRQTLDIQFPIEAQDINISCSATWRRKI